MRGLLGVFLSFDIILFYVFFELTLVPSFFLIGIWGGTDRRHAAAHYAFVGAASYIFAVPEEVRLLFGVDPRHPEFVEQFAELIVEWAGAGPSADGGAPTSALRRATRKTFGSDG